MTCICQTFIHLKVKIDDFKFHQIVHWEGGAEGEAKLNSEEIELFCFDVAEIFFDFFLIKKTSFWIFLHYYYQHVDFHFQSRNIFYVT